MVSLLPIGGMINQRAKPESRAKMKMQCECTKFRARPLSGTTETGVFKLGNASPLGNARRFLSRVQLPKYKIQLNKRLHNDNSNHGALLYSIFCVICLWKFV